MGTLATMAARTAPTGGAATVTVVGPSVPSARPNASTDSNRSAATGARARATASSTAAGTLDRAWRTLGTSPLKRLAMMACALGPVNGGSPASIS